MTNRPPHLSTVRLTGQTSLCRACGLTFKSTSGFSAHRVGQYDFTDAYYGRRCLTTDELRERGYVPDEKGRWRVPFNHAERLRDAQV